MVKKGYKQTEIGVIPEKWIVSTIRSIADVKTGPFGSALHAEDYVQDGTPIITVEHLGETGLTRQNLPKVSEEDRHRLSAYSMQEGDIVFSRVGSVDRNAYVTASENGWLFSGRILRIRAKSEELSTQYLGYYFKSKDAKERIRNVAVGQTMASLNTKLMNAFKVVLPTVEEQKNIAALLSNMDTLISTLEKQITKEKAIKQGTMQELLTGKRRLPGFSGDWIKSNIGSCIIEKPSYGINAPAVDFNGFLPRYIRITDISEDGRYCKDAQASVSAENVEPFLLKTNDIVLARTGASVGKSYIYDEHDGRLVYAGFLIKMSIDPQKADSRFIFGVLHTYDYWKWVAQTSMRSGQPGINGEEYASYEFRMPSDLKEQKAIADILTNMDNEIVTLGKKLKKYRQVKQGMMQQLLTGKIRIT